MQASLSPYIIVGRSPPFLVSEHRFNISRSYLTVIPSSLGDLYMSVCTLLYEGSYETKFYLHTGPVFRRLMVNSYQRRPRKMQVIALSLVKSFTFLLLGVPLPPKRRVVPSNTHLNTADQTAWLAACSLC